LQGTLLSQGQGGFVCPQSMPGAPAGQGRGIDALEVEESRTVKRNVSLLAGAAALGLAVYLGSQLWAQAPAAPVQAPAQTRVALVNVVQVITNYHKFKTFQDELGRLAKPFKDREAELTKNMKAWQAVLENPASKQEQKEEAEKQIKERKRQIEDNAIE